MSYRAVMFRLDYNKRQVMSLLGLSELRLAIKHALRTL